MKLSRYYLFQLSFWIIFPAFYSLKEQELIPIWQVTQFIVFAFFGFFITHAYQHYLSKKKFRHHKFSNVIVAIAFPVFLMGAFVLAYDFLIDTFYYKIGFHNKQQYTFIMIGYFIDGCIIFLPWFLLFHLYKYGKEMGELDREKDRQKLALQAAQIQVILNNLNPHFLFNTFNTIRWLINTNTEKARSSIDYLSEIMRYSTQQKVGSRVTLEEELIVTEKYLLLEKLRFEEDLIYSITCEEGLKQKSIVPFLLLNTIENAIKHGDSSKYGKQELKVNIYEDQNNLIIKIENPGHLKSNRQGFGLSSVKSLLEQTFGADSSVSIQEEKGIVHTTIKINYV